MQQIEKKKKQNAKMLPKLTMNALNTRDATGDGQRLARCDMKAIWKGKNASDAAVLIEL